LSEEGRLPQHGSGDSVPKEEISRPANTARAKRTNVFVSYSHEDRNWLDRVMTHVKPLVHDGTIDVWADTRITPGSEWLAEIRNALASAKVAILIVSAPFLASDFVQREELPPLLEAAKEGGTTVMPLIVRPSSFSHSRLSGFQAVNDPARPLSKMRKAEWEEVLVKLSEDVRRAVQSTEG